MNIIEALEESRARQARLEDEYKTELALEEEVQSVLEVFDSICPGACISTVNRAPLVNRRGQYHSYVHIALAGEWEGNP